MTTKIYLAKSNRANPDHVMMVRKVLLDYDVEIVEFKGGTYSHKQLLKCDLLLIVPELSGTEEDLEFLPLGKGLHEQIQAFGKQGNKCDTLIVYECTEKYGAEISTIEDIDVADPDDYVNYSFAIVDQHNGQPLRGAIEHRVGFKTTSTPSSESRYRLLLTTQ
mgnify:CR=1 FL=1